MDIINEYSIPAYLESNELTFELETIVGFEHIMFPVQANEYDLKPQVEVKVDLDLEKNNQKSVDEGHSSWRLDPVFTAQVFTSLHVFLKGIVGDFPIKYENLKLIYSNNEASVVQVNDPDTNISMVYLKKLVRQDETGIWTVVGYDIAQ
ncbi:hypothetical protein [Ureibacillus manganicus]|uniref:Uncharacterized protein n=1 Tax=Ureibacillus manganicus DSM 26584 TaxID=1384049 RepID=A0A0A3ISR0_9BACL|nr:hypothetical protein [Ureibacillus manganicus]KGR77852.1 hypothetical protein CD29_13250 [Ureibacillus manganicus DSM 26584]